MPTISIDVAWNVYVPSMYSLGMGARIIRVGKLLSTMTMIDCSAMCEALSIALTVKVCSPSAKFDVFQNADHGDTKFIFSQFVLSIRYSTDWRKVSVAVTSIL